jgi:hypothetical protein
VICDFLLQRLPDETDGAGALVVMASTLDPTDEALFEFDVLGTIETIAANDSFTVETAVEPGDSFTPSVELLGPPAGWELRLVVCEDGPDSVTPSVGDRATRTAMFGLDPGETVICDFLLQRLPDETDGAGSGPGSSSAPSSSPPPRGDGDQDSTDEVGRPHPKPGRWLIENTSTTMRCDGVDQPIGQVRDDQLTIEVRRGGDQLVGTGSIEDTAGRLTLNRRGGRYRGTRREPVRGGNATVRFVWRMISDERMTGSATARVRAQGVRCTIKRNQRATWLGPA